MRPARPLRVRHAVMLALLAVAGGPAAAHSEGGLPQVAAAPDTGTLADHVAEASHRFGVPEPWIWAVMQVESNGDQGAVSSAGAMGLMQIMPGTWATLRGRYRLGTDPFDRRDNILAGTAYLREMHDRFGAPGFLAAYNAGPGRYAEYLSRGRPLPAETRRYLARLAPVVGRSLARHPATAPLPDRNSWTRASLFPERRDSERADEEPADETGDSAHPAPKGKRPSGPRESLFVALSGEPPR
ncbi:lytic transglycosylase domain-containing protein [Altererythrobacter sp. N1]|nr:lytic transglycosylase domain-containing protein [Altererythrobacter sp. N1]